MLGWPTSRCQYRYWLQRQIGLGNGKGSRESISQGNVENGVIKSHVYPFILFIENSSHIYYAIRMANFNFLAQTIITILFSLRYSRQNKSSSSTWCQSLSSLNGMVMRVNVNFERRVVVWIESWSWMICEEDVCWVGIPRTCSFVGVFLLGQSRNGVFSESLFLFHVVIMKKY